MTGTFWGGALGAICHAFKKGPPSIHLAAEKGDRAGVEAQLATGTAPDSRDRYGNTPLHIAAFKGDLPLVSALLVV